MVAPQWGSFQKPEDFGDQPNDITPAQKEKAQEDLGKPSPQWGSFKSPETYQGEENPEEEGWMSAIVRNSVGLVSRAAETTVGKYGDALEFADNLLYGTPESAGPIGWAMSKLIGEEKWKESFETIDTITKKHRIPTSSDLRKISSSLTGGYTEPKGEKEKFLHETFSDIASLASLKTGSLPGWGQAAIATTANIGKQAAEYIGFGQDESTYAKLGLWTALSLMHGVNGRRHAAEMMNDARRSFNPELSAHPGRYFSRLAEVDRSPQMLGSDPRSALARNQVTLLQNNIRNDQNSIESLLTAYDGVNASKRSAGMFELGTPGDRNFARHQLDKVLGAVRAEITEVGSNSPGALKKWDTALGAWSAIHTSETWGQWVRDVASGEHSRAIRGPLLSLFGGGLYGAYSDPQTAGIALGVGAAGYKSAQIAMRVWNDPELRKYYLNALGNIAHQNTPGFIKNFSKLNEGLEEKNK